MRYQQLLRASVVTGLVAGLLVSGAFAGKGGKGSGDTTTPKLPPFSYQVDLLQIPGLRGLQDVTDNGYALVSVSGDRLGLMLGSYVNADGQTYNNGPAVIDTNGVVLGDGSISYPTIYPDLMLSEEDDANWSLYDARHINNQGWILGRGFYQESIPLRPYLLIPNDLTGIYELVTFDALPQGDVRLRDFSEAGNGLCEVGDSLFVLHSDGSVRLVAQNAIGLYLNSAGIFTSETYDPGTLLTTGSIVADDQGGVYPLEVPAGVSGYSILSGTYSDNLSDTGFVGGIQYRSVKQRGGYVNRGYPVFYDLATVPGLGYASVSEIPLPASLSYWSGPAVFVNDQIIDGQPVVAFDFDPVYLAIPGYDTVNVITDLMDSVNQQRWKSLDVDTSSNHKSDVIDTMTTPRLSNGAADPDGAPTFYGAGYRLYDVDGFRVGFEGIYVLSPTPVER